MTFLAGLQQIAGGDGISRRKERRKGKENGKEGKRKRKEAINSRSKIRMRHD
jgi:hypothetical protein